MNTVETLFLKELENVKERFESFQLAGKWLLFSLGTHVEYEIVHDASKNVLFVYEKAKKRATLQNEKEIRSFFEREMKEEDAILEKKEIILQWMQKIYPEAKYDGFALRFNEGSYLVYLGKHPTVEGKYQAFYKEEVFDGNTVEEVFTWLFTKVKRPIEKQRLKNLFKEK